MNLGNERVDGDSVWYAAVLIAAQATGVYGAGRQRVAPNSLIGYRFRWDVWDDAGR